MKKVGIFHFNHDYANQNFYKQNQVIEIDCRDLQSVTSYCEEASLQRIEQRAQPFPFLCFLGNGNYHYLSYLHQKSFDEPYTLVLFDHHSDLYEAPMLSCGSWVNRILKENPRCLSVILIGVSVEAQIREFSIPIQVFNEHELNLQALIECLADIKTPIFLSIDKDVLSKKVCQTNWDQGSMSLEMLLSCIAYLVSKKKSLGVDVCGEKASSGCFIEEEKRNNDVNKKIWDAILSE